jgi:threonyl-tRNA synthetase
MADRITLTFPDGSTREYDRGVTAADVAASIGKRLAKDALAAKIDGEWVDLGRRIERDADVAIVTPATDDGRDVIRHSTAHVMAQAVTDLFPGAKYAIGPAISDGFYYDFELPGGAHFTDDDLARVEARMREIVKAGQPFVRDELPYDDALRVFAEQPYKREIIERVREGATTDVEASEVTGGETVSVYENPRDGEAPFVDLCRGPHVPSTALLGAFKLT